MKISDLESDITQEFLREMFHYDPDTGVLTRIKYVHPSWGKPGTVVGTQMYGYLAVRIKDRPFMVHRIVWLYVHGKWPDYTIDHINGNKSDNRLANLREATMVQNCSNKKRRQSRSGIKGVYQDNRTGRWRAIITANNKKFNLGFFATPEEARVVRIAAAKKLHGEFFSE